MTRLVLLFPLLSALFFSSSIVQVVPPDERLTKRMLFVVDASGSMEGPEFRRALGAVQTIAGQPTDELEVAVLAFNGQVTRWPGVDDGQTPAGWAALPSLTAVQGATDWLVAQGPGGDTRVIPAIERALAEDRHALSVVLVTDGRFHAEGEESILTALRAGQAARVARRLNPAVVLVYGVGPSRSPLLARIGREGRGGYFHEQEPVEPEYPELIQGIRQE